MKRSADTTPLTRAGARSLLVASALLVACGQKPSLHTEPTLAGLSCYDCHGDRYHAPATEPDHISAGFPKTCEVCHGEERWRPARFDGHDRYWPLTGAHDQLSCARCHEGGVYAGTPRDCAGCHTPDYEATTDPDHLAAGFPKTCETCHTTAAWRPAAFGDHDQYWPLTGAHTRAACASCHQGEVYAGAPRDCAGCHTPDYEAAADPEHVAAGFPKTCETCHATAAWRPAAFGDHDQYWPLRGRHRETTCASCHEGGVYAGTPTRCDGCHHPDYEAATNPPHRAPLTSTSCEDCHGEASWQPADLDTHNTLFIITYGDHRRYACADCHTSPSTSWASFTCIGCHDGEHTLARMNAEHHDVFNYSATLARFDTKDQGCLHCHPRGTERD